MTNAKNTEELVEVGDSGDPISGLVAACRKPGLSPVFYLEYQFGTVGELVVEAGIPGRAASGLHAELCDSCDRVIPAGTVHLVGAILPGHETELADGGTPVAQFECSSCAARYGRGHRLQ